MRVDRLVLEAAGRSVALDLHPRLTVITGVGGVEQPVFGPPEALSELAQGGGLPLMADEALITAADADKLAPKPSTVSFEHAAASTISGITALQALTKVGRVEAGQRVLVVLVSVAQGQAVEVLAEQLDLLVADAFGIARVGELAR